MSTNNQTAELVMTARSVGLIPNSWGGRQPGGSDHLLAFKVHAGHTDLDKELCLPHVSMTTLWRTKPVTLLKEKSSSCCRSQTFII